MHVVYYENIPAFYERSRPLLEQKPVLYAQMRSIVHSILRNPQAYGEYAPYGLAVVDEQDQILGAAIRTPPFPLMVTEMSDDVAAALARKMEQMDPAVAGVVGPAGDAWKFAKQFASANRVPELRLHMKLYCVREVTHSPAGDAQLRKCEASETEDLYEWVCQFAQDCGAPQGPPALKRVRAMVERGEYFYWEVNHKPVSLVRRDFDGEVQSARISSVFTPHALRCNGYGTSATAALTQQCLDAGASYVTLMADFKNTTSNGIYKRLGYRSVGDVKHFEFQKSEYPI